MSVFHLLFSSSSLLLASAAFASAEPAFDGVSAPILNGEVPQWQITGLEPGTRIRLAAERTSPWRSDQVYLAEAVFVVDPSGRVDPATQAPLSAGWSGVDPFGLFWSATRIEGEVPASETP